MTAVWMLYCLGIGLAFVVVGHALERALHFAGRPARWAWVIAIVGSYVIPVAAWLRPEAFTTFAVPIPVVAESGPGLPTTSPSSTNLEQLRSRSFSLSDLDWPLRWAWVIGSLALVVAIGSGARRLVTLRRHWRPANIDGRDVLISPNVGPAVVGVWAPRVVLPEWALELPQRERELIFAHEEQHVRAADPALNALGFWLILLAPWNPALWWQWRRLRLAIEVDCDARVLNQGCSAAAYGDLLLRVGKGRRAQLVGVAAFGEPVSFLESRIRRLIAGVPRWRWAGIVGAVVVTVAAIVAACEVPRPLVPQALAQEPVANRISTQQADWVRNNIRQFFPTLGDPNGPALDAYLVHDAKLHVYQATLTERGHDEIGATDLRRAFAAYDMGHDGWVLVDRRALQGVVRDNVRVISLHHDPQPHDTMPSLEDRLDAVREQAGRVQANMARVQANMARVQANMAVVQADSGVRLQLQQTLEQLRWNQRISALQNLARESEPAAFAGAHDAIAVVVDADYKMVAHASGDRQPSDRSCLDVLKRLLPAYHVAEIPSGCMNINTDPKRRVSLYWGQLANR